MRISTTDKSLSALAVAIDYALRLKPDVFVEDLSTKGDTARFLQSPATSRLHGYIDNLPKIQCTS